MSDRRKLLIVGAGGRTGSLLTRLAVGEGHVVTALVRRSIPTDEVPALHREVVGDAADPAVVAEAAEGQDAVFSVVAAPDRRQAMAVSDIAKALVAGMDKTGVRRLVMTSSRNITATKPWIAVAPTKWMFRHVYADLVRAEDVVRSSDLDWTIVRAVMLTDDPPRGLVHAADETRAYPRGAGKTLAAADEPHQAATFIDRPTTASTQSARAGQRPELGRCGQRERARFKLGPRWFLWSKV